MRISAGHLVLFKPPLKYNGHMFTLKFLKSQQWNKDTPCMHGETGPTSLLRPSAITMRMPGFLPGSLMGATATGLTKAPSTSQPAATFSRSCREGCWAQVTTYSLVRPEEGCCTFCAQMPVLNAHDLSEPCGA